MNCDLFGKFFPINSTAGFSNNSNNFFIKVIWARYLAMMNRNLLCFGNSLDD